MASLTIYTPRPDKPLTVTVKDDATLAGMIRQVAEAFAGGVGCWLNRDGSLPDLDDMVVWIPIGTVLAFTYNTRTVPPVVLPVSEGSFGPSVRDIEF